MEFIRRHHLLMALLLLSAAVVAYFIGFTVGVVALVVAAFALELTGWYLVFVGVATRRERRR